MTVSPPPQGMNEADYDAIEEAVTETVRGRWFLNEFARRNRLAETRQMLDAMARLEAAVFSNQIALPSTDPSIRLLIQRIKEIASQLGAVVSDMRVAGIDPRYVDAVDGQARAVLGMMRSPSIGKGEQLSPAFDAIPRIETGLTASHLPSADQTTVAQVATAAAIEGRKEASIEQTKVDPRLAALSRLDQMSSAEKLALFT